MGIVVNFLSIILITQWLILINMYLNNKLPYLTLQYKKPNSLLSINKKNNIDNELKLKLEILEDLYKKNINFILINSTLLGAIKYESLLPNEKEIYIGMNKYEISKLDLNQGEYPSTYYYKKNNVSINVYEFENKIDKFVNKYTKNFYYKYELEDTKKIKFYNLELNVPSNIFNILKRHYNNWEDIYSL